MYVGSREGQETYSGEISKFSFPLAYVNSVKAISVSPALMTNAVASVSWSGVGGRMVA